MRKLPLKKFKKSNQPPPKAPDTKKSPSNYRITPERTLSLLSRIILNKYFLVSFVSTFISVAIVLQGIDLKSHITKLQEIQSERDSLNQQITYWEGVIAKHPDYRDGYFKLALLEYRLGDKEKARQYVEKTLLIDPNYQPAVAFQKRITEKD